MSPLHRFVLLNEPVGNRSWISAYVFELLKKRVEIFTGTLRNRSIIQQGLILNISRGNFFKNGIELLTSQLFLKLIEIALHSLPHLNLKVCVISKRLCKLSIVFSACPKWFEAVPVAANRRILFRKQNLCYLSELVFQCSSVQHQFWRILHDNLGF